MIRTLLLYNNNVLQILSLRIYFISLGFFLVSAHSTYKVIDIQQVNSQVHARGFNWLINIVSTINDYFSTQLFLIQSKLLISVL